MSRMTTPTLAAPPAPPTTRFRLRDHRGQQPDPAELVDGGWWPRTLDLDTQLPEVLRVMYATGFDIRRVVYNLTAWNPPAHRIVVEGRLVKLGGFRTQSSASITLVDTSNWNAAHQQRFEIVVVPPDADPAAAERCLALAGRGGDRHRAAEILRRGQLEPKG
jgi:hypothetical protein